MSKEQQELLDESYKDYFIKKSSETGPFGVAGIIPTKDEFINNLLQGKLELSKEVLNMLPKFAAYTLINADEVSRLPYDKWFEQFKKK